MASESLRVFVGNLPWATTEEGLRKAFSACGAVAKAEIAMSKNGQRPRGYVLTQPVDLHVCYPSNCES